jgi:oxygen-dependent protoporphyrinogen oxidase
MLKLGVVGGGISGLTLTYKLSQKLQALGKPYKILLIEKSNRVGGWIKSRSLSDEGITWETGPRSLRIAGVQGLKTLKLVSKKRFILYFLLSSF